MTREDFQKLKDSGLFWEIYPWASGNYEEDLPLFDKTLKPCPFCGSKPVFEETENTGGSNELCYFCLGCINDNCPARECHVEIKALYAKKKETNKRLKELWNTRIS